MQKILAVCLAIKSPLLLLLATDNCHAFLSLSHQSTAVPTARTAAPPLRWGPFSPETLRQHNRLHRSHHDEQMTRLHLMAGQNANDGADDFHDDGDGDDDDAINDGDASFFDVEAARKQLESLVTAGPTTSEKGNGAESRAPQAPSESGSASSHSKSTPNVSTGRTTTPYSGLPPPPVLDVFMPPRPPLTTIERARREREMELLSQLAEGDDAVPDLWTFWFSERGEKAKKLLHQADELMNDESGDPSSLKRAEDILFDLISEHGVFFTEPVHRLATLYYLQEQYNRAEDLFKMVLSAKPWHFGSLSGIVMVYERLGDSERAQQWAARRLPAFMQSGSTRRRARWTERALLEAKQVLEDAERSTADLFGAPDLHMSVSGVEDDQSDAGAWQ